MNTIPNTEQTAVTKPALDFSGSCCLCSAALCELFSFVGETDDESGGDDDEFSLIIAHIALSEICDLSQPKKTNINFEIEDERL